MGGGEKGRFPSTLRRKGGGCQGKELRGFVCTGESHFCGGATGKKEEISRVWNGDCGKYIEGNWA